MHELAHDLAVKAIENSLGQSRYVLVERDDEQGRWHGYTEDYLPTIITPPAGQPISRGKLLKVRLNGREDTLALARAYD